MARAGQQLVFPNTREALVFRKVAADTNGELVEFDYAVQPGGNTPKPHIHPKQEERFEVLSGSARFRVSGTERDVHPGEVVTVPPGESHFYWNAGDEETRMIVSFQPALRMEDFLEVLSALSNSGISKSHGLPGPLWMSMLMREYKDEVRRDGPPYPIQVVAFGFLGAIARAIGLRPTPEYANRRAAEAGKGS